MSFLNVRFPTDIGYGSRGGPGYSTTVIENFSGYESRNQNWEYARYVYDVAYGVKTIAQLETLIKMFHIAGGKANGFKFKDRLDYKSCDFDSTPSRTDVEIGTGDGTTTIFQVIKKYTYEGITRNRKILKLVPDTLLVDVAGVSQTRGVDFTASNSTGLITFTAGHIPTTGQSIKCGYEFDVPVRFGIDELPIILENYRIGSASVPLIEDKSGT